MSPKGVYDRPDRSAGPGPRPERKSMRREGKLNFEKREGYHRRVVNDVDGRIQDFLDDHWQCVTGPAEVGNRSAGDASTLGSVVRKPVGGGLSGVLMEIPEEWYEQDQAEKEAKRLAKETSLLDEAPGLDATDGIKIDRPTPRVVIQKP